MTAPRLVTTLAALAFALLLAAPARAAEVLTTVEPRIVDEFDTVRLTIRATGTNQAANLDLAPLRADFEVLTTQSSSQYRSVNGRVESWVEYQVMLRPRRSGDLTIPPIAVGNDTTEPLRVRVRGIDPSLREAIDRMVFFETELTANPVYVQAQTVLVRRLYYASGAQIYSDLPGMPDIPEAIVLPLGETSSTATIRDGQRYGVIEQRFAILPERSGKLTIPAISVTSSVRLQSGGRTRRSGVRVATEPLSLEVLPIPPGYPSDHPWLPAENLTLSASWLPDRRALEVGDPVRLTLGATIRGNVSSAIPPLDPALPESHFRRYPEPPDLEDDDSGASVRGLREQAYAIIPTAPGAVAVPAIEVVWWDVVNERVSTARLPGRTLSISGVAADVSSPPLRAEAPTPAPARAPEPGWEPLEEPPLRPGVAGQAVWILGISAALIALLAWLLRGHLTPPAGAQRAGAARARRELRAACRSGEPTAVHAALLEYLREHYRAPLPEAIRSFRAAGHGAVLDQLNATCYRARPPRQQPDGGFDAAGVLRAADALRRPRRADAPPLPALYD